jgi:uncharacterized BrkB/YihY/UPF0761 family membrane protein
MTAVLGIFLLATTLLVGLVTIGHHGVWITIGAALLSLVLNVALFAVAFPVLTHRQIVRRDLLPGAVLGGLGWTVLQYVGGLLVDHSLRNTSKEYGSFALVLGLMAFLYLSAQVTVYAAEFNVVKARHLWPWSIVQPPLTKADRVVLSYLALESKRRPEQFLAVGFVDQECDDDVLPTWTESAEDDAAGVARSA